MELSVETLRQIANAIENDSQVEFPQLLSSTDKKRAGSKKKSKGKGVCSET